MFVSWDEDHGWSHVTPSPTFAWQPQLQTTDPQFNAAASFSVIPSVSMHFNNLFSYTMTATPELDVTLSGDLSSRQVRVEVGGVRVKELSGTINIALLRSAATPPLTWSFLATRS
jgi:hypothetical protein